jgi:hypothetical protein
MFGLCCKTSLSAGTYEYFLSRINDEKLDSQERKDRTSMEETSINIEMLVYLKFWEADNFIKKLYELVKLAYGEPYDWLFRLPKSPGDKKATVKYRHTAIRELIRDRMQNDYPNIFNAIKSAYKTQIRNAIAHSNYAFQSRCIQLYNYEDSDITSNKKSITANEWIEMFHLTIIIHQAYIMLSQTVNSEYINGLTPY